MSLCRETFDAYAGYVRYIRSISGEKKCYFSRVYTLRCEWQIGLLRKNVNLHPQEKIHNKSRKSYGR